MENHSRGYNRSHRKYLSIVMLSLLFLMSSRCDDIEDPSALLLIDLAQTSGFDVIVSGGTLPESDFFPLRVGTEWTYELVHADADTASEAFAFPANFTISVIGIRYVDGIMYNTVDNYLIPGADFPATALMRKEGSRVYILIDGEDHLLYSFDSDSSQWMVPMKMASEIIENRNAETVDLTEESAVVSWDLSGFPGPDRPNAIDTEAGWADVFNRGLGRVRIVSVTDAYGLIVWDLKEIIASDNELVFPEPNPNSYFPLQVGNQWAYYGVIEAVYSTVSVIGGQMIDGKIYFEYGSPLYLFRDENGVIYSRSIYHDTDYVYIDSARSLNEEWRSGPEAGEWISYISSNTDTVISDDGPIFNCIKVRTEGSLLSSEFVFAPGVGRVSIYYRPHGTNSSYKSIDYAIINGDTISFPEP